MFVCFVYLVCYPNGTNFRCRCEDQYVWSYQNCNTYGACDEINDDTCGCINSIPSQGQYCQPKKGERHLQYLKFIINFVLKKFNWILCFHSYILEVEITVSGIALIEQLRDTVENISFPVRLSNTINITKIDMLFTGENVIFRPAMWLLDKLMITQLYINNNMILTICFTEDYLRFERQWWQFLSNYALFFNSTSNCLWIPDFHWSEHYRRRSTEKHREQYPIPRPNQQANKHLRCRDHYRQALGE